jgi:hypothetical protein
MGYRWYITKNTWSAEEDDILKLTVAEILKYTPTATAQEQACLKEYEKQVFFANARLAAMEVGECRNDRLVFGVHSVTLKLRVCNIIRVLNIKKLELHNIIVYYSLLF